MSDLTLLILRLAFLALLWVFVFSIVYSVRSDLFGPRARRGPDPQPGASSPFPSSPLPTAQATVTERIALQAGGVTGPSEPLPDVSPQRTDPLAGLTPRTPPSGVPPTPTVPRRLVITSGPKEGAEIALDGEQLTIGRSSESDLVVRDDYTSTHHARLLLWGDHWVVQDLDSTNGTFLDGTRVTVPTPLPAGTPVRIGTTTFELRR
jgi:hypothetical protein